jgi:hypothetical protein
MSSYPGLILDKTPLFLGVGLNWIDIRYEEK